MHYARQSEKVGARVAFSLCHMHIGQSNLDTSRTVQRLQSIGVIQRLRNRSTISGPANLFLPVSVFLLASHTASIKYEHRFKV